MATKNIVPRADGEGSLGRAAKQWGDAQVKKINGKTPAEFVAAETPKAHALDAHTSVTLAELNAKISDKDIASTDAATTSAAGLVELATDAETIAGTATDRAVTPATLSGSYFAGEFTVTVGTGGTVPTISDAFAFLLSRPRKATAKATIQLLSGFELRESVYLEGANLGWVTLTSVDSTVPIIRSAMTGSNALAFFYGTISPLIGVQFVMDTSGTTARDGISIAAGATVNVASGGVRGASVGLHLNNASTAWILNSDFSACATNGIKLQNGSRLAIQGTSNFRRGGTDSTSDLLVQTGSFVSLTGTFTGGYNLTKNSPTAGGLILAV